MECLIKRVTRIYGKTVSTWTKYKPSTKRIEKKQRERDAN